MNLSYRLVGLVVVSLFAAACTAEGDLPNNENGIPLANAGENLVVAVGSTVELSGADSVDPDGDTLTYRWQLTVPAGSSAALNSNTLEDVEFGADTPGTYRVVLIVNDGFVDSSPDTVTITAEVGGPNNVNNTNNVNNVDNRRPIANAGTDQNVQTGMAVQLNGTGSSDPDGDSLTFDWLIEGRPAGSTAQLSDTNVPQPTFTPDVDGEYELSVVVSDGQIESVPDTVFIRAFSDNTPPIANAGADQTVATGSRVQLDGSTSFDADADPLTYVWSLVSTPNGSTTTLSASDIVNPTFTPDTDGDYVIRLIVNDGSNDSNPDELVVTSTNDNVPPVAHAGVDQNVAVGATVTLNGSMSSDANDDAITYSWSLTTVPSGSSASLSSTNSITPTFDADVEGTYIAQLVVNDGEVDSPPNTVTIVATLNNVPPVANAGPDQPVQTGDMVILDGTGSSDADGDTITYNWTITAKPAGSTATLDDSSSDIPIFTADLDGTYVIQLMVNDGNVDSAPDSTVVTAVTPSNPAPTMQGQIIITEIMMDPDTLNDTFGEWFEVYNPSTTQTYDLQNCVLEDFGIDSHTIGGSLSIGPQQYLTFARNSMPGFTPDYVYSGFLLANGLDEIILSCGGNEISNVIYGSAVGFPAPVGASIQLIRDQYGEVSNDMGVNWCVSTNDFNGDKGTPGLANEFQSACQ